MALLLTSVAVSFIVYVAHSRNALLLPPSLEGRRRAQFHQRQCLARRLGHSREPRVRGAASAAVISPLSPILRRHSLPIAQRHLPTLGTSEPPQFPVLRRSSSVPQRMRVPIWPRLPQSSSSSRLFRSSRRQSSARSPHCPAATDHAHQGLEVHPVLTEGPRPVKD